MGGGLECSKVASAHNWYRIIVNIKVCVELRLFEVSNRSVRLPAHRPYCTRCNSTSLVNLVGQV